MLDLVLPGDNDPSASTWLRETTTACPCWPWRCLCSQKRCCVWFSSCTVHSQTRHDISPPPRTRPASFLHRAQAALGVEQRKQPRRQVLGMKKGEQKECETCSGPSCLWTGQTTRRLTAVGFQGALWAACAAVSVVEGG